jgi:hypothetical protein
MPIRADYARAAAEPSMFGQGRKAGVASAEAETPGLTEATERRPSRA